MNQLDLKGRNAVVTGGAAGIGFAIAQRLAASGARVSLWDRDDKALAQGVEALGKGHHTQRLDVSHEPQVMAARTQPCRRSAASMSSSAAPASPAQPPDGGLPARGLEAGARHQPHGCIPLQQGAGAHMQKNDYGRIVNIASIAARKATRTPPPTAPRRPA
jgi:3-oxoacyl-[acyl-carrier protein] reductase